MESEEILFSIHTIDGWVGRTVSVVTYFLDLGFRFFGQRF
jgi:hypothetical protein